jgi:triacylglycerol lipase
MQSFNDLTPNAPEVKYYSYAAVMRKPSSDLIMGFQNAIIQLAEGPNDGLVTVESAQWGEFLGVWESICNRGISHMDVLDFRKKPFSDAAGDAGLRDICDAWVSHVERLKADGL